MTTPAPTDRRVLVTNAFRDSWDVVRALVTDPAGRIGPVYARLASDRALAVGIALCLVFAFASAFGALAGAQAMATGVLGLGGGMYGDSRFSIFLRTVVQMLIWPAAAIGISLVLRRIAGQKGPVAADAFVVGVALTPLGIAMLLAGVLSSLQLGLMLLMTAYAFLMILLFTGLTAVGGLTSRLAFIGAPIVVIVSLWITQAIVRVFW